MSRAIDDRRAVMRRNRRKRGGVGRHVGPVDASGIARFIMSRWHRDDLAGRLSAKSYKGEKVYEAISFPALRDPETGAASMAENAVALSHRDRRWVDLPLETMD